MTKEHYKGFVAGIAYSAARMKDENMDAFDIVTSSGISLEEFKEYAEDIDLEVLNIEEYFE